jgi:hypothetical protein
MTNVEAAANPANAFEERLAALDELCRFLTPRLRARLQVGRANPGGTPPTFSVTGNGGDPPVVSFGLIDAIYFWTFDGGVSNHYSKDKDLMTRIIASELARSGHLSHAE